MKAKFKFKVILGAFLICSAMSPWIASGQSQAHGVALHVSPGQLVVTPELLKDPPSFRGSGFKPGEAITIELGIPEGVSLKGMTQDEGWVGIAFAWANEMGEFHCNMTPTAMFNWLFQVEWTEDGKPDMSKSTPLPPQTYKVKATGMHSERVAETTWQVVGAPR